MIGPNLSVATVLRYYQTLKHLKPHQIIYRLYYFARKRLQREAFTVTTPPIYYVQPLKLQPCIKRCSSYSENTFTFLNRSKRFVGEIDWNFAEYGKLWNYNLHYLDYLHEEGRSWASSLFLLDDWLRNNQQGMSNAWEPFPVSLRLVNWRE